MVKVWYWDRTMDGCLDCHRKICEMMGDGGYNRQTSYDSVTFIKLCMYGISRSCDEWWWIVSKICYLVPSSPNTTSNKKLMQLVFNVTEAWYSTYTWSIPRDWGVLGFVLHKQRTPFIYGVIVPRPWGVLGFVLFKQRNPFRSGCTTVGLWSFGTPRIMKLCPPQTEPLFNSVAPVLDVFYSLYILVT